MSASKTSKAMSGKTTSSKPLIFAADNVSSAASRNRPSTQPPLENFDWKNDEDLFFKSRTLIAEFFRKHRSAANVTIEQVRDSLSLESVEVVAEYESGSRAVPLEDVFALTNLLNIPPEEVLALIVDSTSQQGLR